MFSRPDSILPEESTKVWFSVIRSAISEGLRRLMAAINASTTPILLEAVVFRPLGYL
jgi:hypothetical protein